MKPGQAVPERSGSFFGLFVFSVVRHSFEARRENGKYFRKNRSWGIPLVVGLLYIGKDLIIELWPDMIIWFADC